MKAKLIDIMAAKRAYSAYLFGKDSMPALDNAHYYGRIYAMARGWLDPNEEITLPSREAAIMAAVKSMEVED